MNDLAQTAVRFAEEAEARGLDAGVVRRLARSYLELLVLVAEADADACPWCGGPVEQPARGRPRVHCTDRCRKAAWRARRKGDEMQRCDPWT